MVLRAILKTGSHPTDFKRSSLIHLYTMRALDLSTLSCHDGLIIVSTCNGGFLVNIGTSEGFVPNDEIFLQLMNILRKCPSGDMRAHSPRNTDQAL